MKSILSMSVQDAAAPGFVDLFYRERGRSIYYATMSVDRYEKERANAEYAARFVEDEE